QLLAGRFGRPRPPRALAGEQRGEGGDDAGGDREPERDGQAVLERVGDHRREEVPPSQVGGVRRRQVVQLRPEQLLDRVVAQEGGEQYADRGQVADRAGGRDGDAVAGQAA